MNEHEKSEITFNIVCEYGKLVETVFVSEEEFEAQVGKSPFLWEVLEHGEVVLGQSSTEWKLDFKIARKEFGEGI